MVGCQKYLGHEGDWKYRDVNLLEERNKDVYAGENYQLKSIARRLGTLDYLFIYLYFFPAILYMIRTLSIIIAKKFSEGDIVFLL